MINTLFKRSTCTLTIFAALTVSACGGGDDDAHPARSPEASPAPPVLTTAQVKAALLSPKEVSIGMRKRDVSVLALQAKRAPMCSLSDVRLAGNPDIVVRQFSDSRGKRSEPKYAQLVAAYTKPADAFASFGEIRKAAEDCPKKQHVPSKKIPNSRYILLEHDDTWKIETGTIENWSQLRGLEKHVEPPSQTKDNVYHFVYDYAVRGNIVVATLYWERGKPSTPAEPVAERATEILTKQLRKIG